jgi:K(+)-stimulated pyrophosphate-energized sodium pump
MLGGYMAGVTVSGVCFGRFFKTMPVARDKKSLKLRGNGEMTFKGSDAHKAAVTGDTVMIL